MSSLFKRVPLPLLAVAAAATLCTPIQAATATLDDATIVQNGSQTGIAERVKCSMTDDSTWHSVTFNAQLLGGGGSISYTPPGNPPFTIYGPGDDYYPSSRYDTYVGNITQHGTYNCWAVCSGVDYYNNAWNASTGGTYYITY